MFDFLPPVTTVPLRSAPLSQVTAQVKFSAQTAFNDQQGAALLHDVVSETYPRLLNEQQQTVIAGPGGLTSTTTPQWRLTDLANEWSCVVSAEQLALETTAYDSWSEMHQRLDDLLGALDHVAKIRVRERLGLRYINQIPPDEDGSFSGRIEEDLLGPVARPGWRSSLTAALAQSVFHDNATRLVVRVGTGEGVVSPANLYVVDIDCFEEQPARFERGELLETMSKFNDAAYRCFCSCVSESFRTSLK